ncbi:hypothetical protein [Cytobacillus purgationiresistens]|uniref:Uncharacterized protein n=1 Tax=Cytobacillus purgationiresistens TaxID=863449 RepID=A0ABU0AJY8_9BACI|nr:hypothetical protein [Cytobacillus purgationiresistens]MDQ0271072.1 hypothetical protein [Cytobacillus purgationiresistens]
MTYIIENANVLKNGIQTVSSFLIENGRISSVRDAFPMYRYMRMDASSYIMTPSHVRYIKDFPIHQTVKEGKAFYIEEMILKGCMTFLTTVAINYEHQLHDELMKMRTNLLNCPVDYIIGVQIPVRLLKQSFILQSKHEKIPAIFVEIKDVEELEAVPWGWVREALFPYNSPLIPIFTAEDPKERMLQSKKWVQLMEAHRLPSVKEELEDGLPLTYSTQAKIGIFPFKSHLHHGFELSYNFYLKSREITKIEELELYRYHSERLIISVHKGRVIRAGDDLSFKPGSGEYVMIKTPSYYQLAD